MLRDDSSVRKKTVALKTVKVSNATVKTTSSDGQEGVDSALAARVRRGVDSANVIPVRAAVDQDGAERRLSKFTENQ